MKDIDTINKEREGRINLSLHRDLIETVCKVEYKKFSNLGLIDLSELINLANYTVYYLVNNSKQEYNEAYLAKAIRWAIRNEMRRRYKWHAMKDDENPSQESIKDAVYKTILSIDEMAEAENPTLIKDSGRTPDEKAELLELKARICEVMKKLPQREQDLIEAKYFYDKKLKDISAEFNISQSRISRIIQNALDKVKKELLKQEKLEDYEL
ncbi:sigma-70 family RNA polymerase sigma factor [bacterium]|nr:sigma-70 family RNA polymerase sigma factor [bacterium]